MHVIGNEKIKFRVRSDGKIDYLEVELNPTGAASDRFSPLATWKVTMTRSAIREKLRSLAGKIGDIQDFKPSRIGNSGRAIRMQVIGSRGSTEMNGYSFRNALGLRDTLFTITRAENPDGSIASFTFNGRGWGHGVGMCQVGAFGMARAGKSYEEILKTYYQGVAIRKAY
jgi:stage II sporulation protein D